MGLNIIRRYLSCNHWVTFCIDAAAASYYQNTDRTVQTQPSWLHGFSGCILMIFCDVKSGKRCLHYYSVRCTLLVMYSWYSSLPQHPMHLITFNPVIQRDLCVHWEARCLFLRTSNGGLKNSFIPQGTLPTQPARSPHITCSVYSIL